MSPTAPTACPWCGSLRGVVHVHGHGQCLTCKSNTQPCCGGDNGNDVSTQKLTDAATNTAPDLFAKLFDVLGGRSVTVTTASLLSALSNRLGSDLDEARLVLEAAERVGVVRTRSAGLHSLQHVVSSPVDPPGSAP